MTITVELPDDVATRHDAGREALEALVIAGFESEQLSSKEARLLLGMARLEFQGFLKQRGVTAQAYGPEELAEDVATGDRLRREGLIPS